MKTIIDKTKIAFFLGMIVLNGCGDSEDTKEGKKNTPSSSSNSSSTSKGVNLKTFKTEIINGNEVKLSWDAVDGASSYRVKYAQNFLTLTFQPLFFTVAETSINLGSFASGEWFYSVKAEGTNIEAISSFTLKNGSLQEKFNFESLEKPSVISLLKEKGKVTLTISGEKNLMVLVDDENRGVILDDNGLATFELNTDDKNISLKLQNDSGEESEVLTLSL